MLTQCLAAQVVQQHQAHAVEQRSGKTPVGVFVGVSTPDYADLGKAHSAIGVYTATGSAVSVAAGRLSYFFGFSGPSVSGESHCDGNIIAVVNPSRLIGHQLDVVVYTQCIGCAEGVHVHTKSCICCLYLSVPAHDSSRHLG